MLLATLPLFAFLGALFFSALAVSFTLTLLARKSPRRFLAYVGRQWGLWWVYLGNRRKSQER